MNNTRMLIYDTHNLLDPDYLQKIQQLPFECHYVTTKEILEQKLSIQYFHVIYLCVKEPCDFINHILESHPSLPSAIFLLECVGIKTNTNKFRKEIFIDCIRLNDHNDLFLRKLQFLHRHILQREALEAQNVKLQTLLTKEKTLKEHVEKIAEMDYLTKIPNRRKINSELERLYRQANRYQIPISILMIDIDDFKHVNDEKGHPFGDSILQELCAQITSIFQRPLDVFGRFGGDEFIAIMYDTNIEGAKHLAHRILGIANSFTVKISPENIYQLSVSIGISTRIPSDRKDYESLLAESDKALYFAKNNGKNQFSVFTK